MAKKDQKPQLSVVEEAKSRLQYCMDADGGNRAAAIDDLKFSAGDQWPVAIRMQRELERRPCLTINKTDTFVRSVVNNMRQQRPRITVHPVSGGAVEQVAEVIQGLVRHIEVQSNADVAYDSANDFQVRMGWGYFRICSRYVDDKSFDQELYIDRVRNPFSVYFDPASQAPDGSDAMWCVITGKIKKEEFEKLYPGKALTGFPLHDQGDETADYAKQDEIVIAEYYRIEEVPDTLFLLSDGSMVFKSQAKENAKGEAPKDVGDLTKGKDGRDVVVSLARPSMRRSVVWSKISGSDELETRPWPGKYIPVIPVYGAELIDAGKVIRYGMVRQLKDPQRMYNFWRTQETEFVALAPKAPWLIAEGQDEGHEDEWNQANTRSFSRLIYKPITDPESGQLLPPPERLAPQQIPAASVNAAMSASEDLKAVAGMFDPSLGAPGQETSGRMVQFRQQQSDLSNFHFYDNFTRSHRFAGIQLLDLIPHYYDTHRVIRIIGSDGNAKSVTINEQAADKVLNDVTVGRYDVVMDTGPGYETKRQDAADNIGNLMKAWPQLAQAAGDIFLRNLDFPGAREMADRIAATIPAAMAEKDLPKDLDPQVRTLLVQMQSQLKTAQQQIQQLSMEKEAHVWGAQAKVQAELPLVQMREEAETQREVMRERVKAEAQANSEAIKLQVEQRKAEIDAQLETHKQSMQAQQVAEQIRLEQQRDITTAEIEARLEVMKRDHERELAEKKLEMDRFKAELDASVKLQIAQMQQEQAQQQMQAAKEAAEKATMPKPYTESADMDHFKQTAEALQAVAAALARPKKVLRDDDGNILGVE